MALKSTVTAATAGTSAGIFSTNAPELAFAYAFVGGLCVVLYRLSKKEPMGLRKSAFPIVAGTVFGALLANVSFPYIMPQMPIIPKDPKWLLFTLAFIYGFFIERIILALSLGWDAFMVKLKKQFGVT